MMAVEISPQRKQPTRVLTNPQDSKQGAGALVVAIDGPAASGKSSVAKALAAKYGLAYINTGAMYRAVTWSTLQAGIDPADTVAVTAHLGNSPIGYSVQGGVANFTIGGHDPGIELKSAEVNSQVSAIASIPEVRERLVELQREFGKSGRIVMEGRDIGSVVFPHTPHKFYIDASEEVRRARRSKEGFDDDLAKRDKMDSQRAASPLVIAKDATVIDSSELTIDEVVEVIVEHLSAAL